MEVWKDVVGYEGIYQVSSLGNIKSLSRDIKISDNRTHRMKGILRKKTIHITGYETLFLNKNKTPNNFRVHRIVALTFIPNPLNKKEVNHKNGIKTDNRVENLEWCTRSENQLHAIDTGLQIPHKGVKNGNSLLTDKDILEIRKLNKFISPKEISLIYGVVPTTIYAVLNRRSWKHI